LTSEVYFALDRRTAHADRDDLLLAAPAADRPFQFVADMCHGLQHVEGDTRNRRVANGTAELAVADLIAAIDAEHEFARPISLAIGRALYVIALLHRADHVIEPVRTGQDRRVAHADQRLRGKGIGARIAGRHCAEPSRRLLAVEIVFQNALFD